MASPLTAAQAKDLGLEDGPAPLSAQAAHDLGLEDAPPTPAHEGPGVIKSAVASFLHAIPGSESMAQAEGIPNFNGTVQQARADHPIASAAGTLGAGAAGAAMGPSSAIVGGLAPALAGTTPDAPDPKAKWYDQAMSGVQAAGAPMLPGLAAAGLTKLGQALPTLTGLGIAGATAAGDGSAYDKAIGIGGGALMAGAGALGNLGRLVAKPVNAARESVLRDLISEFLPQATKEVKAQNTQGARDTRAYAGLLKRSTSPIGGGDQQTLSIPGQPDLQAQAIGKLGAEAQESYRYLRSKDPLGLKLTPEAEQGVGALLPDYEAGANQSLAKFAGGKEARLQELLAELRGSSQTANRSVDQPSHLGFFPRPDLLPTTGTLKPNPLAGFTPKELPTETSVAPQLQSQVDPRLDAMRKEQGVASRIASGAGKGMGGNLTVGGALLGKPKLMVGGGLLGAGKALVNDPVVATTILEPAARALQAAPELGKRLGPFLAGTKGPMLAAKLNYLMQHDKEFKAAVEAQKAGQ